MHYPKLYYRPVYCYRCRKMATRPKSTELKADAGSRTALRENPIQSISLYGRVTGSALVPHAPTTPRRTTSGVQLPGLRKPSVQPATSPPVKRIAAAPVVATPVAPANRRSVQVPAIIASETNNSAMLGGALLSPVAQTRAPSSSASVNKASQTAGPIPIPSLPGMSPSTSSAVTIQARAGTAMWKKAVLAAVPGFFGLMGLSQLYQGRKAVGSAFLFSGILLSFLSAWYSIILGRLDSLLFKGQQLTPYALSYLSSIGGNASFGSKVAMDLLGVMVAIWGLSVYDALGSVFSGQAKAASLITSGNDQQALPVSSGGAVLASTGLNGQTTPTQNAAQREQ